MPSAPTVTIEHVSEIALIRYANAPSGVIATKGAALLTEAVERCLADPATRCLVLTGADPGVFIRHADVAQIGRAAEAVVEGVIEPESFVGTPFWELGRLLDDADKPVIAAINGICMGGGLEIALACSMRLVAEGVREIGLPEIRIGIFPGSGGTQRLARVMGRHKARLFMLLGRVVDAQDALSCGIVDEVCVDPVARALAIGRTLARRSPAAIASILQLTRTPDLGEQIDSEMRGFGMLLRDDPGAREEIYRFVAGDVPLHLLE